MIIQHNIMDSTMTRRSESGFTLIELSIVLVIIGLIVGGILSGQQLIKSAEIRATMKQVEGFNIAVNAFRNKYDSLAGDAPAERAPFGATTGATSATAYGDDNGILTDTTGSTTVATLQYELTMFWEHLSMAQLIEGHYDDNEVATNPLTSTVPRAVANKAKGWGVYSANGTNYFYLGLAATGPAVSTGTAATDGTLTGPDARIIDTKMDDSLPDSGVVQAQVPAGTFDAAGTAAANGVSLCENSSTTPNSYTTDTVDTPPALLCNLKFNLTY